MKAFKLVTGILCIILTFLVLFQSCAAGLSNALSENGEISGSAGFILSILMLTAGITQIATRKTGSKGGSIACAILFVIAALIGFVCAGTYSDLKIWAGWCFILGVVNIISIFIKDKK